MTKAEELLRKEITMFDWSNCGRKTQMIPYEDALKAMNKAINYTQCCTEFADGKCRPMVNADWTYLRCECGKRFEPKG